MGYDARFDEGDHTRFEIVMGSVRCIHGSDDVRASVSDNSDVHSYISFSTHIAGNSRLSIMSKHLIRSLQHSFHNLAARWERGWRLKTQVCFLVAMASLC